MAGGDTGSKKWERGVREKGMGGNRRNGKLEEAGRTMIAGATTLNARVIDHKNNFENFRGHPGGAVN